MNKLFLDVAWEDYLYWQKVDKVILKKINGLLKEIESTPFEGTGKPEPLKHQYSSWWSRKINLEHRLVYMVENSAIIILQCRYHT